MANESEEQEKQEEVWRNSAQACCGEEVEEDEAGGSSCCSSPGTSSDTQPRGTGGVEAAGCGVSAQGQGENQEGESGIIRITPHAVSMIKSVIESEGLPADVKLRIKVVGGGCAGFSYDMGFEEENENSGIPDIKMNIDGVNVVIDSLSSMYLRGTEIDYVDTLMGTGFKFNNDLNSHCGCGNSFSPG